MTYIKKLVMHGFKSFAKKTELPFTEQINVILGPNGSGKSNVSDALCFVLGRLSAKSMRAAKAKNLIFMGTKSAAPSKEAVVEMVFDNEDKTFSLDSKEVSIKRIVRKNGQSIYKINDETKTRQEILALLAQAGIDPNGFNIILQGEIQNFVKMHTEDRREIIEEVAGISIYESRKAKSLKELERTEDKLKEVLAILRERTIYLNNLERERQQALKYKKLQKDVKRYKASIIKSDLTKKQKHAEQIQKEIDNKNKEIQKTKKQILDLQEEVATLEEKIITINKTIQKSTGLEQEALNQEIANLRAELAGLNVKQENSQRKSTTLEKQKQDLSETIRNSELELKELQKESPTLAKNQSEINKKKKELAEIEEQRKKFYMTKSELKSLKDRLQDKKNILQNYSNESNFLLKQLETLTLELFDKKSNPEKLQELKKTILEKRQALEQLNQKERELEKANHTNEFEIQNQEKIIEKISKLDICPLCKSKITEEHLKGIQDEINPKLSELKDSIEKADKQLTDIQKNREILSRDVEQLSSEISKRDSDLVKLSEINSKKDQLKAIQDKVELANQEVLQLYKKQKSLEENFDENSNIEQKYETLRVEVQEISLRSSETVTSEISFKQRELERSKISLNQATRELEDIKEELEDVTKDIEDKETLLEEKKEKEEELTKKFREMIHERDSYQSKIREVEINITRTQNVLHSLEQQINNFKIDKARVDAEIENLEIEILEFSGVELIKLKREKLVRKLEKTQHILENLGSVNLKSLEVYDEIKKEYDAIKEKTETIEKEKESIMKIIHEIDIKKKKAFMKTFEELNEKFSRNFAQISTKGQVYLELEDKKDPFEAGVGITVKTGHGKYFDVTSLSGGEQTMVALSLIFAIQELKPYCFYVLDEIDAALDKRNSERLASLLKKYMQKGQYLVITHNDEIITNATNLYGVSMHDGISKVVSLKI